MNKRYQTYESRLEAGGLADELGLEDSALGTLRRQVDGLRTVAFGSLLLTAVVLAFLIYQSLVTTKDLAVLTQDGGVLAGKLDSVSARVTNIEGMAVTMVSRVQTLAAQPVPETESVASGAPRDWTRIYVDDLTLLLPYLQVSEAGTGELWIYSNNDDFIDQIADALRALSEQGVDVNVEDSQ